MIFRYYFLKEGNRVYDKSELITFLKANPYIRLEDEGMIKKAIYHNPNLKLDATFVFNNKSIIERIERLNPKYLDLNIYVEIPVLTNTYKVNRIIDIIQEICFRFDFAVYNEYFEDVSKFDRSLLVSVFNLVKKAYKKRYEDEFVAYSKINPDLLDNIYAFLDNKAQIETETDLKALNYVFLRENDTRNAYTCLDLTFDQGFLIPPACKLARYIKDGKYVVISYEELIKKIGKYCKNVTNLSSLNVLAVEDKYVRKINKVLTKTNFDKVIVPLSEVELDQILDL
ncbi:MAG: hypothetical protein K6G28_01900 [Acholeplasmatales bacterium]|nr:hypothetical protein [Acholeplasmatales bacterium]